jgi:threonine/homoserine/homoserine lactone efflux protein
MVSPVPILAAVIIAGSRRRFSNGPAFLGGWFVGLLLLMLLFSVVGARTSGGQTPIFVHWVELALGLFLCWLAWREWSTRKRRKLPGWVEKLDEFKARNTAALGFLLATAANPKNIPLTAAAGAAVAESEVGATGAVTVSFIFAIVSSLTVGLSIGISMTRVGGRIMDRFDDWLQRHTTEIMVPLFLLIGALLVSNGVQGIRAG